MSTGLAKYIFFNPSNAEASFIENQLNPVMLVFII